MTELILLVLATILLLYYLGKGKKAEIIKENVVTSYIKGDTSIMRKRQENLPLINEWIDQLAKSKNRRQIKSWEYTKGESDEITFTFFNGQKPLKGRLYFKSDFDKPRVSALRYEEDGRIKTLKGLILPSFKSKTLLKTLRMERKTPEKLSYINEVMGQIKKDGNASFSIPLYEGITEEEFKALYKKSDLSAFKRMLEDDFKVSVSQDGDFTVELKNGL